jgi:hypothetical protein
MNMLPRGTQQTVSFFILLSAVLLQSVAIPVATHQIQVVLPVGLASLLLLLITKRAYLNLTIVLAFAFMACSIIVSTIANLDSAYISYLSAIYFFILYLPFSIKSKTRPSDMIFILRTFQRFVALASILAVAQFISQILFHFYFDIKSFIPPEYFLNGYNTTYKAPVLDIYKSNGYFFLEPSFLSQFCAMAIIFELLYFRRIAYVTLYFIALVLSFSGTGILLILLVSPMLIKRVFWLFKKHLPQAVAFLAFSSISLIYVLPSYLVRIQNQSQIADNSLSVRWIYPVLALQHMRGLHIIYGFGPGSESRFPLPYFANFTAPFSVVFQYGLVGVACYLLFVFLFFKNFAKMPFSVTFNLSVLIPYLILSGALLQPFSIFIILALAGLWNVSVSHNDIDFDVLRIGHLEKPHRAGVSGRIMGNQMAVR